MISIQEKNYRHHLKIVEDVLTVTENSGQQGIAITPLCQKGNLAHGRLRNLLATLTGSGLVNQIKFDGKNTFVITDKGRQYLEQYKKFSDIAEGFGLEM